MEIAEYIFLVTIAPKKKTELLETEK